MAGLGGPDGQHTRVGRERSPLSPAKAHPAPRPPSPVHATGRCRRGGAAPARNSNTNRMSSAAGQDKRSRPLRWWHSRPGAACSGGRRRSAPRVARWRDPRRHTESVGVATGSAHDSAGRRSASGGTTRRRRPSPAAIAAPGEAAVTPPRSATSAPAAASDARPLPWWVVEYMSVVLTRRGQW